MQPIVLQRNPVFPRERLPNYTEIDHPVIREAAAAWDAAKATLETAKKDLTELEQTREQAEWADAEAAEKARAEGKAEPKRTHVAQHDKKTDEARHELKVATLAEQRAFDALQAALDAHQGEWAASIEKDVQQLDEEWQTALATLRTIHTQRARAYAIRKQVVGGKLPQVGVTPLGPIAQGAENGQKLRAAVVQTDALLAVLAKLGERVPEEPREEPERPEPQSRWDAEVEDRQQEYAAEAEGRRHAVEHAAAGAE